MPYTVRPRALGPLAVGLAACAVAGCGRLDDLWSAAHDARIEDASPVSVTVGLPDSDEDAASAAEPASAEPAAAEPHADAALTVDASVADAAPQDPDAGSQDPDAAASDASADGAAAVDTRPTITALAMRTGIVESPNPGARWIGYVRVGGRVPVVRGPVGNDGCPERRDVAHAGWYQVDGGGYVCVGPLAALSHTLDARGVARRFPVQPDLGAPMPFLYGITSRPAAMYRWAPSLDDERLTEPERFVTRAAAPAATPTELAATAPASPDDGGVVAPTTASGDAGAVAAADVPTDAVVRIEDLAGAPDTPLLRRMLGRMYVSLDREVRAGSGASYWHTQTGGYVRASVVGTLRAGPSFQGVRLEGSAHLPVAFALSNVTPTYQQAGSSMEATGRAPRLTFFQLTGDPPVRIRNEEYHRTSGGFFVRSRNVRIVTAHDPPADLAPAEKWIDVNLDHQSLVAYEGTTPVYVTLGSTGLRSRGVDNYETIQGGFRIQSKHVATTMDGNSDGGPYSIEDVPWVMYFEQSFALHGAFWHNGFGLMHSHGCVNLSPPDARWVFGWSEPRVPPGWHGAYATTQTPGTRVFVHYDQQNLGERGGPARVPTH